MDFGAGHSRPERQHTQKKSAYKARRRQGLHGSTPREGCLDQNLGGGNAARNSGCNPGICPVGGTALSFTKPMGRKTCVLLTRLRQWPRRLVRSSPPYPRRRWLEAPAADTRPVTLVVPIAAGGGVDTIARVFAALLAERLKQPWVVENRPGAGGMVGLDFVAKATPDGHTLATFETSAALQQWLHRKVPFDVVTSFAPVAQMATTPLVLFAGPSSPVSDLKGMIAYAKANPGKLSVGSPGMGTPHSLAALMLNAAAGIEPTPAVPMKSGWNCVVPIATDRSQARNSSPGSPTISSAGIPPNGTPTSPRMRGSATAASTPAWISSITVIRVDWNMISSWLQAPTRVRLNCSLPEPGT